MGEAAKISLKALGKQDTYLLSKDPDESFFNYTIDKRHANFRKYHRNKNIINPGKIATWPFGETIKVQFDPRNMGDFLSNMWMSITLPGLDPDENYADQIGRHILKSITMYVDDLEVEKIHDDWGIIYDEIYLEMSEKVANRFLVNRNLGYDDSTLTAYKDTARYDAEVVIPLHFFFARKYSSDEYSSNSPNRPYFPVCSVYRQKIEFEFEFHKQTFFTDTAKVLTLPSFNLVTEEITISGEERNYWVTQPQLLVTDLVKKHPVIISEVGKSVIRNNLVPNIPVKCIHWFLRNTTFENEDEIKEAGETDTGKYYIHNRFNFSSNVNFSETYTFYASVMDEASFYINGNKLPNVTKTDHTYYKYLVPSQKRLSRPIRNIYTYSFSMNPVNVEPSGNLDFSAIQSDKTNIEVKLKTDNVTVQSNTFSLNMYYTGYQTFTFDEGFMRLAY